jgi:hypothetical protein
MSNQINLQKIIITWLLLLSTNFLNIYIVFLLFFVSCINTESKIIMLYMLISITYGINFTINFSFLKNILNYMNDIDV